MYISCNSPGCAEGSVVVVSLELVARGYTCGGEGSNLD